MKKLSEQKRRILFPIFMAAVSWILLASLIYFINPEILQPVWYAPFWILVWIASTWSISLVLGKMIRGIFYGTAISVLMVLRFLGIGHLLNGLLLFGLAAALDLYFMKTVESY